MLLTRVYTVYIYVANIRKAQILRLLTWNKKETNARLESLRNTLISIRFSNHEGITKNGKEKKEQVYRRNGSLTRSSHR